MTGSSLGLSPHYTASRARTEAAIDPGTVVLASSFLTPVIASAFDVAGGLPLTAYVYPVQQPAQDTHQAPWPGARRRSTSCRNPKREAPPKLAGPFSDYRGRRLLYSPPRRASKFFSSPPRPPRPPRPP